MVFFFLLRPLTEGIFLIFAVPRRRCMIKDFFDMTRHERRGAIVILVIIALVLAVTFVMRCHRPDDVPPASTNAVRQFEAEVDSSAVEVYKPSPKKTVKPEKKGRKSKSPKPTNKPKPEPRRMDPVPQF